MDRAESRVVERHVHPLIHYVGRTHTLMTAFVYSVHHFLHNRTVRDQLTLWTFLTEDST